VLGFFGRIENFESSIDFHLFHCAPYRGGYLLPQTSTRISTPTKIQTRLTDFFFMLYSMRTI
jgi:hypothetical protein